MREALGFVFDMVMLLAEDFKYKKGSRLGELKEIIEILLALREYKNIKTKHFDITINKTK